MIRIAPCVYRFLSNIRPSIVLIAETEIWPIFASYCKKYNISIEDDIYPVSLMVKLLKEDALNNESYKYENNSIVEDEERENYKKRNGDYL